MTLESTYLTLKMFMFDTPSTHGQYLISRQILTGFGHSNLADQKEGFQCVQTRLIMCSYDIGICVQKPRKKPFNKHEMTVWGMFGYLDFMEAPFKYG